VNAPAPSAYRVAPTVLGLRENWRQFWLLVLVNAFVGAMVGLERSVLPLVASEDFGLKTTSAVLSFIASFGLTKAFSNLAAGWLVERQGRRWTLVTGWLFGLPVPVMILFAPTWWWIVAANALLGINQGLAWSATVIMKIDLVGPRRRGLAMGLNEFSGYLAVAAAALGSGLVAGHYGLRAGPAWLGLLFASIGLFLSVFKVRDTSAHARLEDDGTTEPRSAIRPAEFRRFLARSVWSDPSLSSVSQAGFVNNLNDGVAWGLFPLLFTTSGLSLKATAVLAAIYPATWSLSQVWFGALSDRWGRKVFIASGMIVQGVSLLGLTVWSGFWPWAVALAVLGIGTGMVYPTLLAAAGDLARPRERALTIGSYRLWRDLGYVAGALGVGLLADIGGMNGAIRAVAALTLASGVAVAVRFRQRPPVIGTTLGFGNPSTETGEIPSLADPPAVRLSRAVT
jgi:MFS family permease